MKKKTIKYRLNPKQWIENYTNELFYYTFNKVNKKEVAEDIIQETFEAAYSSKEKFRGEASEKTYLYSILKKKIIDYYRKKSSNKEHFVDFESPFITKNGDYGSWDADNQPKKWDEKYVNNSIEEIEFQMVLNQCFEKLPPKHADSLRLKTIQNVDTEEICNRLNISVSNFWVHVHRARLSLRKCLEINWFAK